MTYDEDLGLREKGKFGYFLLVYVGVLELFRNLLLPVYNIIRPKQICR